MHERYMDHRWKSRKHYGMHSGNSTRVMCEHACLVGLADRDRLALSLCGGLLSLVGRHARRCRAYLCEMMFEF